jgi:menaquinone-dependent protoporphyrinogen oxidase
MRRILVLYATREGHTRRIAGYLAAALQSRGFSPHVVDAARLPAQLSIADYCGVILAASIHRQTHESEMTQFVKQHLHELNSIPSAFLSVSLSQAGAQKSAASPERSAKSAQDVRRMIDAFLADTGWHPLITKAVAGALTYSKYNFVLRRIMKWISRNEGGDTDTSRDYDYTDWKDLDELVADFTASVMSSDQKDLCRPPGQWAKGRNLPLELR